MISDSDFSMNLPSLKLAYNPPKDAEKTGSAFDFEQPILDQA